MPKMEMPKIDLNVDGSNRLREFANDLMKNFDPSIAPLSPPPHDPKIPKTNDKLDTGDLPKPIPTREFQSTVGGLKGFVNTAVNHESPGALLPPGHTIHTTPEALAKARLVDGTPVKANPAVVEGLLRREARENLSKGNEGEPLARDKFKQDK